MQDFVQTISEKLNIPVEQSEKAVGTLMSLVQSEGDTQKVDVLFAKVPGARELAEEGGKSGGGGLFGMLSGMAGGPLAAVGKLQATGLDMDQIKVLGNETLVYLREKAGDDVVREVTDSIPGLSKFV